MACCHCLLSNAQNVCWRSTFPLTLLTLFAVCVWHGYRVIARAGYFGPTANDFDESW
jgi:hypothetical protein